MSVLLAKLRKNTANLHNDLEEIMFSDKIIDGSITQEELNQILLTNFLFFSELENQIFASNKLENYQLNRAKFAEDDLKFQNVKFNSINSYKLSNLTYAELLGYLYVALGSSLGGIMITKRLEKNSRIQPSSYTFYKNSKNALPLWREFLSEMKKTETDLNHEEVTSAACSAFNDFKTIQLNQTSNEKCINY